ncbi:hypothetical protein F4808DRAFT_301246 [Astrocystis sublimbata]|nr:hypothetical protein F4808DRAFT_301246 [Astrocystis sublimbata]
MLSDLARCRDSAKSLSNIPGTPSTDQESFVMVAARSISKTVDETSRVQELCELQALWLKQDSELRETKRRMGRLEADVVRLQTEDAIASRDTTSQTNHTWRRRISFLFSNTAAQDLKDATIERDRGLNRKHYIRLKAEGIMKEIDRLFVLSTAILETEAAIGKLKQEIREIREIQAEQDRRSIVRTEAAIDKLKREVEADQAQQMRKDRHRARIAKSLQSMRENKQCAADPQRHQLHDDDKENTQHTQHGQEEQTRGQEGHMPHGQIEAHEAHRTQSEGNLQIDSLSQESRHRQAVRRILSARAPTSRSRVILSTYCPRLWGAPSYKRLA